MKQIQSPTGNKMMQKRIPTWFGLAFLVVALVIGVVFISQGPGVFAPRATPQTTPKKVKVTNVTDNSFTLSFLTDESSVGFVKYGTSESDLKSQASDDRDQLSGSVGEYQMHHITVRGLLENTSYYYVLGTGSGSTFDNNGSAFQIKTARRSGAPSAAKTVYGSVTNASGGPADGAVVYVALSGAGEMSSLVKNSGSWAVPLSNARTTDGSSYATISDSASLQITAQGTQESLVASITVGVASAQPVPSLSLGSGSQPIANPPPATAEPTDDPTATESAQGDGSTEIVDAGSTGTETSVTPSQSAGGLTDLANSGSSASQSASPSAVLIDVSIGDGQEVDTTQPTISGQVAPSVQVSIQVNSETQITTSVTADANGMFELDLSELGKELEPGEHTVTYSYVDPNTGQSVEKTVVFFVAQSATAIVSQAQASTIVPTPTPTPTPFGSGNPYPATASATPTPTPTPATDSGTSTRSAMPSTQSGVPVSGSVGTTIALVFGGLFFIISGVWSFWISSQLKPARVRSDEF